MRIIDRVFLIGSRSDFSERTGINNLTAPEGRFEDFAVAAAAVDTTGTEAAHGDHALGTVEGQCGVIGIGPGQVHLVSLPVKMMDFSGSGSTAALHEDTVETSTSGLREFSLPYPL